MLTSTTMPTRRSWSSTKPIVVGALLSAAAGVYAFAVPKGLPYDEPSHWAFVRFLAGQWALPVIGDARVGYEAQMGPVGYLPGAALVSVIRMLGGSDESAFYAVRLLGCVLLFGLFVTVRSLATLALPDQENWRVTVGSALAVFNPMVVAMSISVQNDATSLLLLLTLLLWVARTTETPARPAALGMGVLAGAALLAKVSLAPAVAVCLIWFVLRFGRHGIPASLVMTASSAAVSSWWFLRNLVLYADVTGRTAVSRLGIEFPPLGREPSAAGHLGRSVVVYLTLPVEYFRNLIQAPTAVEAVAAALVVLVVVLGALGVRGRCRPELLLLIVVGGASVLAWGITAVFVQAVAFRTAYGVLPLYAVAAVGAIGYRRGASVSLGVAAALTLAVLALHAWVLLTLGDVTYGPGLAL